MIRCSDTGKMRGFTLIEVAIVMIIGSVILTMAANFFLSATQAARVKTTEFRLHEIDAAVKKYMLGNDKLPNAAPRNVASDTVNFGREITSIGAAGTVNVAGVSIGAVPTRTLNLPDDYSMDAWGTRFIYAVTNDLTQTATFNPANGAIHVNDSAGNSIITPAGKAIYIVVSVGGDRAGSFTSQGTASSPCPAGQLDRENCDDDATFISTLMTSEVGASHFDDFLVYQGNIAPSDNIPSGAVMAFNLTNCPPGWFDIPGMEGRVVIGAGPYADSAAPPAVSPGAYSGTTYGLGTVGGWSTRMSSPGSRTDRIPTMPPYKTFRYCQKS